MSSLPIVVVVGQNVPETVRKEFSRIIKDEYGLRPAVRFIEDPAKGRAAVRKCLGFETADDVVGVLVSPGLEETEAVTLLEEQTKDGTPVKTVETDANGNARHQPLSGLRLPFRLFTVS